MQYAIFKLWNKKKRRKKRRKKKIEEEQKTEKKYVENTIEIADLLANLYHA
jgi:hypothetical protein